MDGKTLLKPNRPVALILGLAIAAVTTAAAVWGLAPVTSAAPANTQVVPTPTPTPTPLPTFTDFYRSTTEGFSLSLPAGWVAQETGGRIPALTVETPPGAAYLLFGGGP